MNKDFNEDNINEIENNFNKNIKEKFENEEKEKFRNKMKEKKKSIVKIKIINQLNYLEMKICQLIKLLNYYHLNLNFLHFQNSCKT